VAFAADLESALKKAKELRPEVVLLDIGMPVSDGYEVAKRLRALPEMDPNSVYMAISGFGQPENLPRSAEAGFKRHLVKPVEPNTLQVAPGILARDASCRWLEGTRSDSCLGPNQPPDALGL
jgi:CheY-like chemotaxis protein